LGWTATLINLLCGVAAFALCSWRAQRPPVLNRVRMIPWTTLSLVAAVWAIFMLVHVVNLLGIETGRR
jgi:uncharacterized membrane protein YoaK (UPF0700 family)